MSNKARNGTSITSTSKDLRPSVGFNDFLGTSVGMDILILILLVVGAVFLLLAAINWSGSKINLVAAGLLCWIVTVILARL